MVSVYAHGKFTIHKITDLHHSLTHASLSGITIFEALYAQCIWLLYKISR